MACCSAALPTPVGLSFTPLLLTVLQAAVGEILPDILKLPQDLLRGESGSCHAIASLTSWSRAPSLNSTTLALIPPPTMFCTPSQPFCQVHRRVLQADDAVSVEQLLAAMTKLFRRFAAIFSHSPRLIDANVFYNVYRPVPPEHPRHPPTPPFFAPLQPLFLWGLV